MFAPIVQSSTFTLLAVLLVACSGGGDGKAKGSVSKDAFLSSVSTAAKSAPNSLVAGQAVTGTLETTDPQFPDKSHYDQWTYDGKQGEQIQITLESSAFDAYLLLGRQNGESVEPIEQDDDGAGGTNARISVALPADGTYLVMANSFGEGATGAYTLRVDRGGAASSTTPRPAAIDFAARYPGGGDPKGRYAVMVGIDDYQGIANNLNGPVADARLMGRILVEQYGFLPANVIYITDREATREHITEAFLRHLGQAGPEGVAVFYYSGHGMQMEENLALTGAMDPEPDNVDEALVMWGADGRGGILLDDELGFLASRLRTDRVLMIMDACFSGTGTRGGAGGQAKEVKFSDVKGNLTVPISFLTDGAPAGLSASKSGDATDLLGEPDRHLLLAASSDDQLSWTASGWPKYGGTISVFTYYLAEAMEASAQNATFAQVMQGVSSKTLAYTQSNYNARQSPQPEGRSSSSSIREFLRQR
ncbi:MAG: caspase family protein [Gemmatimonadaceae bacterium]